MKAPAAGWLAGGAFVVVAAALAVAHRNDARERDEAEYRASFEASRRAAEARREADREAFRQLEDRRRAERERERAEAHAAREVELERQEQESRQRQAEHVQQKDATARVALERARENGSGCNAFDSLGPLPAERAWGEPVTNPCGEGIRHVQCRQVRGGWFVPLSVNREGCGRATARRAHCLPRRDFGSSICCSGHSRCCLGNGPLPKPAVCVLDCLPSGREECPRCWTSAILEA